MDEQPIQPENKDATRPVLNRITIKPAAKKSETARIDLASVKPPPSILDKKNLPENAADYFGRSTMRIEVGPSSDGKKSDTARIDLSGDSAKKKTAKIELPPAAAPDAKSTTIALGIPALPAAAKPKMPVAAPMRPRAMPVRPQSAAVTGESIVVSPQSTANAAEQARKSETARIDIAPEELDRTTARTKSIRIKRADGSAGRKPLEISKPEGAESAVRHGEDVSSTDGDEPGLLAGIMAIAATLVAGAVFYMLLAQTVAPSLPFPGKL